MHVPKLKIDVCYDDIKKPFKKHFITEGPLADAMSCFFFTAHALGLPLLRPETCHWSTMKHIVESDAGTIKTLCFLNTVDGCGIFNGNWLKEGEELLCSQ